MAMMSDKPHVSHVPTMTGGSGYDAVRHFYENYFVGRVPDDWTVKLISRSATCLSYAYTTLSSAKTGWGPPSVCIGLFAAGCVAAIIAPLA